MCSGIETVGVEIASKPAASASRATVLMSAARQPAPGMTVTASRSGSMGALPPRGVGCAAHPAGQDREPASGPSAVNQRTTGG